MVELGSGFKNKIVVLLLLLLFFNIVLMWKIVGVSKVSVLKRLYKTNSNFFSPSSSSSSSDKHEHTHVDKPTQRCTKTHELFDAYALVLQRRSIIAGGGNLFYACSLTVSQNLQEHYHQNANPTIHSTPSNHHHPTTTTITC